jgi:hypothetical protein
MERKTSNMVTATLTKVLHRYGDVEVQETMRFADRNSAEDFRLDMLNVRVKGFTGSPYTITAVTF